MELLALQGPLVLKESLARGERQGPLASQDFPVTTAFLVNLERKAVLVFRVCKEGLALQEEMVLMVPRGSRGFLV